MATTSALPKLDNTMGCLFLGGFFSTALWGVAAVQLYLYYEKYSKTDKLWLRLYLVLICALDTAHQVLVIQSLYNYLVKGFGNYMYLFHPQRSLLDVSMLAPLIDAMVQSIFLIRVWTLSNGNYVLTGVLTLAVLGLLASCLTYFGQSYRFTQASQLIHIINTARIMHALVVVADTAIALALIFLLRNMRSGIRKSDSVVKRLVMYTIGTGLITSIWGIVGLVGAITMPNSFIYLMVDFVMPKLYLNCVLASLNSRSKLREDLAGDSGAVSIQLSNLNACTDTSGGSSTSNTRKGSVTRAIECKVDIDIARDPERQRKLHKIESEADIEAARSSA